MPDVPIDAPVPFGVYADTGEFESAINRKSLLKALRTDGPGGTLPLAVLKGKAESKDANFGVVGGDDVARDLSQAGWAVLYGPSVSEAIKRELDPLLARRRHDVGDGPLFKVFEDYAPGQTAAEWLAAPPRRATMQVVDPDNGVPYYVLIVASPEEISFEFQFELDLYWGVGRLWFSTAEEFGCYARSVVAYEEADSVPTARELALFGTLREGDRASQVLAANVFDPWIQGRIGEKQKFSRRSFIGDTATKNTLHSLLSGDGGTPALLFTGSHGLLRSPTSSKLADTQGALICQDWPGTVPATQDHYYAASDFPQNPKIHGMIYFMFACFGGGWPRFNTYQRDEQGNAIELAPRPMMARLPQAVLGRENGALAVLAHVDKAYGYSYTANNAPQNQSFKDVLIRLMNGQPVGHATDQLNLRWAGHSCSLLAAIESLKKGDGEYSAAQVENLWVARNDARNYVVLGDPAVRLRVNEMAPAPVAT